MASVSAPAQWLADELAALLSAPHALAPELFNTRFNAIFMRHARGLVGGREVDREGLKQSLLALQKNWDAAQLPKYADTTLHRHIDGFHVSGAPLHPGVLSGAECLTDSSCGAAGDGRADRVHIASDVHRPCYYLRSMVSFCDRASANSE